MDTNGNLYANAGYIGPAGGISGAQFGASAGSTAQVPIVARGAGGQAANLQEWQNSAGTAFVKITANGNLYTRANAPQGVDAGADVHINAGGSNDKPLVVRGYSSQLVNLQEWQDNTGALLANVSPAGTVGTLGLRDIAGTGAYLNLNAAGASGGSVLVNPRSQTNVALVIEGRSGQTANKQEWQDSTGAILAHVASNGTFQVDASGAQIKAGSFGIGGVASAGQFFAATVFGDAAMLLTGTVHVGDGTNYKPIKASAFTVSSAREMKMDIRELEDPWTVIKKLRPVRYAYRGDPVTPRAGFIADEVAGVFPEAVSYNGLDEPDGIHYGEFTPLIIAAMHRFDARLSEIERRLAA
jgi:hypothetical protein